MISYTKKTFAREVYVSPLSEVLDVKIEEGILQASIDPVSIEDWEPGISLDFSLDF